MSSIQPITTYKYNGPVKHADVNDEWRLFLSKSNSTGFDFIQTSPTNVEKQTPKYVSETPNVKTPIQKTGKEKKKLVVKNPEHVRMPVCLDCDQPPSMKMNVTPSIPVSLGAGLDLDLDLDLDDDELDENMPVCDDLYISTKTKVLFLNQEIDINDVFWNIPVT
jgi:hypothetical protein